jgi:NADP-dependent 3-hydroxy acid dehydrogenase YdfG
MSGKFAGKVALVTGASSGIGEAAALTLAQEGATVAVSGRRKGRLDDLVTRIQGTGAKGLALPGDVSVEANALSSVEDTVAKFGRIDILINSAGANEAGGLEALSLEQWHRVIDINLMGTIYTCKAALPHMKAQGSGDIINISSTAGRRSTKAFAAYATSKFGVTGFTEALRQECGLAGIRVGIVEPGATATDIADSISDPKARAAVHEHTHKEGAMLTDDIVAALMLMLTLPRRANVTRILVQPTIDVTWMP